MIEKYSIVNFLKKRITGIHKDFLFFKVNRPEKKDWIEGYRSRLDELLLLWHEIHGISFIDACKEFHILYEDLDVSENKGVKE